MRRFFGFVRPRFARWRSSSDIARTTFHPDDIARVRFLAFPAPANQSNQNRDVCETDDCDVSPEACVARHCYFDSALVAIPTFVICARWNVSIRLTNFCTGSSRSGRITIATSGFARFNSASRVVNVSDRPVRCSI